MDADVVKTELTKPGSWLLRAWRADRRILLIGLGLIVAGLLHDRNWPGVDTLTASLIGGGLLILVAGSAVMRWAAARVQSVAVGGVFELALSAAETSATDDEEATQAVSAGQLADEVEGRLRDAARHTPIKGIETCPRGRLVATLAKRGYLDRADAAVLDVLLAGPDSARSEAVVRSALAINARLRIHILRRTAEECFERQGIVAQQPGAPRIQVGFHFMATMPDAVRVHCAVVIAKPESELPKRRAARLAKVPGPSERWLISRRPLGVESFDDVRVLSLEELPAAIETLRVDAVPNVSA